MSEQSNAVDAAVSSPPVSWAIVKISKVENLPVEQRENTPRQDFASTEPESTPTTSADVTAPFATSQQAGVPTLGNCGFTLDELEKLLCQKPVRYVVEGLLPADEVHVVVGDSGLGKTPWAYQLGLCVAEGKPFLGHQVRKTRVLYFDLENGFQEILDVSRALCGHLGIKPFPKDLIVVPDDGNLPPIKKAVEEQKPGLVIVDTLRAYRPEAEMDNASMGLLIRELRGIARENHTAILLLHHVKKPSKKSRTDLFDTPTLEWLLQASGPRALINQTNTRIGIDGVAFTGQPDVELVMKSFVKVKGESGEVLLKRAFDGAGEPVGYKLASEVALLGNKEQVEAFNRLTEKFSFKDAKQIYGKTDNPTRKWLIKCRDLGLIKQTGRGIYQKILPSADTPKKAEVAEEGR